MKIVYKPWGKEV